MKFLERMSTVALEAKAIRESITMLGPGDAASLREAGYRPLGTSHKASVARMAELLVDVYEGKRPTWHLREAMTTSDFPLLFGDVLYRQLLGNYALAPVSYPEWTTPRTANDFRALHMYLIDGGGSKLDLVPEGTPYPETTFTEAQRLLSVAKYGRRYGITWEMVINDDLNAFETRPMVMAQAARWSEEYLATQQLCDANGANATFFTAGNGNIVTGNPALSIAALQTAFGQLGNMLNSDGVPISIKMVKLVVPPNQEIPARNILNATEIRIVEAGGTTNQLLNTVNWMRNRVQLVVNTAIPIIATAKPNSWFLIADPADATNRPAFVFGHLRGYTTPQLFVQSSNQMLIGGGVVGPQEGDFDTDSINYKVRHVFGAAQGDPKMAVGSSVT